MTHYPLIYSLVQACNYRSYLELGVWEGCLLASVAKITHTAVGVDISDVRKDKSTSFFLGSTRDFFLQNKLFFDFIFIDADHRLQPVTEDFVSSMQILNEGGLIAVHDTDPASKDLLADGYCSDSYRLLERLNREVLSFIPLPVGSEGLTLISRSRDKRVNRIIDPQ